MNTLFGTLNPFNKVIDASKPVEAESLYVFLKEEEYVELLNLMRRLLLVTEFQMISSVLYHPTLFLNGFSDYPGVMRLLILNASSPKYQKLLQAYGNIVTPFLIEIERAIHYANHLANQNDYKHGVCLLNEIKLILSSHASLNKLK